MLALSDSVRESRRRGAGSESGFTLVEMVMSVAMLMLVVTAVLTMLMAGQKWLVRARQQEHLVNFTASYMESIRGLNYAEIGTGPSASPTGTVTATETTVGKYRIAIEPRVVWVDDPTVPGPFNYKRVTLAATSTATGAPPRISTTVIESIMSSLGVQ